MTEFEDQLAKLRDEDRQFSEKRRIENEVEELEKKKEEGVRLEPLRQQVSFAEENIMPTIEKIKSIYLTDYNDVSLNLRSKLDGAKYYPGLQDADVYIYLNWGRTELGVHAIYISLARVDDGSMVKLKAGGEGEFEIQKNDEEFQEILENSFLELLGSEKYNTWAHLRGSSEGLDLSRD